MQPFRIFGLLLIVIFAGQHVEGRSVCYEDLGCFSTESPFWHILYRPVVLLPQSPEYIDVRFYLYTRRNDNRQEEQEIRTLVPESVTKSNFMNFTDTRFVIHGFLADIHHETLQEMRHELLKYDDMNVIGVDWRRGATIPYTQAAANTRVVGAIVTQFIEFLIKNGFSSITNMHLIGHSLGAHTAGYAGERLPLLPRITGLDPAEPYFQYTDPQVRLDPTDALFVDVIHTDMSSIFTLGFGLAQESGHVDFFPNGGREQPGCTDGLLKKIVGTIWELLNLDIYAAEAVAACSHIRVNELFASSINSPCPYTGYSCERSWGTFTKGRCLDCSREQCVPMGFHAHPKYGANALYLKTFDQNGLHPLHMCGHHTSVEIKLADDGNGSIRGYVYVQLIGTKANSDVIMLNGKKQVMKPGNSKTKMIFLREDLGLIKTVSVHYEKSHKVISGMFYSDTLVLEYVKVVTGETDSVRYVCDQILVKTAAKMFYETTDKCE